MKKKAKNGASARTIDIESTINNGIRHHQAGDLQNAENLYKSVLRQAPEHPAALHLLGVIEYQKGSLDAAASLMKRALAAKTDFPDAHSNLGNVFRDSGNPEEAEKCYRRAIELNSRFTMAHYNLGTVLASAGRLEEAAESFCRAIAISPDLAEGHVNLGIVRRQQGMADEAERCYKRALFINPDSLQARFNLGNVQLEKGKTQDAATSYRWVLARDPSYLQARLNLGNALRDLGKRDEAAVVFREALEKNPGNPGILLNLGAALRDLGRDEEAVSVYREAAEIAPDSAINHFNLGNALRDLGKSEQAAGCYERALSLEPDSASIAVNFGNLLRQLGQSARAIDIFRKGLGYSPGSVELLLCLGNALKEKGKFEEAATCYRDAIKIDPNMAEAYYNLGTVLQDLFLPNEAVAAYRRTLALKSDHTIAHSNLLMNIQYDPSQTPGTLRHEAKEWERFQLADVVGMPSPEADPDPERRIRIGYVSGDLRRHPVGYFLDGVLASHDRSQYEPFCYANQTVNDDLTERLKNCVADWRNISVQDDPAAAETIRNDRIDILVDLSGHTARNRLTLFGRKPAPVQATWAGYVGTTGLSAIDYLISDRSETPEGTDDWYVEKIIRLPDCYVCYSPPDYAPEVAPLPAVKNGFVTFGSFNNLTKLNREVLELWTQILRSVPDARLLVVTKGLSDAGIKDRFLQPFRERGVADRVEVGGMIPHQELLGRYGEVDISLDPFPYSGGLTTLESLWMGVPVITLGGERFAARHSISHLTAAGLTDLIVSGKEEYVARAKQLAGDLKSLDNLRKELRKRVGGSPLCDCRNFTRNLEEAYRAMWREWCLKNQAQGAGH